MSHKDANHQAPEPLGLSNYKDFADRYGRIAEDKPHNAYYNIPAVLSLLPDRLDGLSVLDAGCGPGFLAADLSGRGARVTAFDVTPAMVEMTRNRLGPESQVLLANLEEPLEFAGDASFDFIVCPLVLSYVEDWDAVFAEFYRVLRPGGSIVVSTEHPHGEYEWLKRKHGKNPRYFATERHTVEWRGFGDPPPQIRFYRRSLASMINPMLDAGLILDHVLEPLPTQEFRARDQKGYYALMDMPVFILFRAKKPRAS